MSRSSVLAGVLGPILFVLILTVVSLHRRPFLASHAWSPVRRSAVEWPSILLLSPDATLVVATFVVYAASGVILALALLQSAVTTAERVGAVFLGLGYGAVALEAFRPDQPCARTWEGVIHNGAYPVIPLAAVVCLACYSLGQRCGRADDLRIRERLSRLALPVVVVGVALTNSDAVAQLGRYLFFGSFLGWQIGVGLLMLHGIRKHL